MRLLSRTIFRELFTGAVLGVVLFTFVLFLQKAGRLFAILVHFSGPAKTVAYLFSLAFPQALTFTVPLGVLAGVLLGLSRMSGDGEITALRASGVPGRSVAKPVLAFAILGTMVAATCSLWLTPWTYREQYRLLNQMAAEQVTADIQPRIFEEQFPRKILYIGDAEPGAVVRWRHVFLADVTPPEDRPRSAREGGDGPKVTLAAEALATPDVARNRIQLSMSNQTSYQEEKDVARYNVSWFNSGEEVLEAQKPNEQRPTLPSIEMDTWPLYKAAYRNPDPDRLRRFESRVELHQRFALPLACFMLSLLAIPLGVSSRKGGKSGAVVLTVAMAFLYFLGMISLNGLARQGRIPVPVAVWTPNVLFAIAGIVLLARLEMPGDRDVIGTLRGWVTSAAAKIRESLLGAKGTWPKWLKLRITLVPQVIDAYVLSSFLFYLPILLVSFVLMYHVFTFFELLTDIIRNHVAMSLVLEYLFFLTPKLIYDFAPFSVLVGVLITFGVFSKQNEVTAFKACGVSLYRLAVPVLLASAILSGTLFAFDYYFLPETNRRQDALRNVIKGKSAQTYLRPDRKWIHGRGEWFYYYRGFDADQSVMAGVSVFEVDPATFQMTRHIQAEKARWEPALKVWVFQNGWSRDFHGRIDEFHDFRGQTATFAELNEPPDWFIREVKQYFQMNFQELASYIQELSRSGLNTVPLQVQYHKKFAVALFALIMALISVPLSFAAGARGAMAGVGVSFGVAIAYFTVSILFEQVGNLNQLPPQIAAWAPDAVFTLTGLYFMARLRS